MNCKNLNENIRLEEVLFSLGHHPTKYCEKEAWFLNPFGTETEASFKIDRQKNVWYLFSEGVGGKATDFIVKLFNCSVSEALSWAEQRNFTFSFQKQTQTTAPTSNIVINEVKPLSNLHLKNYLTSRGITKQSYYLMNEVKFTVKSRKFYAIGFENISGGYELRNSFYKGCSSKDISIIRKSEDTVCVFEGFLDAVSFLEIYPDSAESLLILNSVSMIEKGKLELKKFKKIKLFLDNDKTGVKAKKEIISHFPNAQNCSDLYKNHSDFNDFLVHKQKAG